MQSHSQTQHSTYSTHKQVQDIILQQHIPWWQGLDKVAYVQLKLPAIETLLLHSFDVVVIGGGVAGLSAALSARQAGASVLVLEREALLGYGATGRNAGILSAGINMHLVDLPLDGQEAAFWPATTQMLLSLVQEASQPDAIISASLTGALSLAEGPYAARKLVREANARVQMGLRAEMWTAEQVAEATDGRLNTQSVRGALWLPDEGRLHPLTLLAHLARKARAIGVQFAGLAEVIDAEEVRQKAGNYCWHVTLSNGMIVETTMLIYAVGPTAQPTARIFALAFAADLPATFPLFWDAAPYTYADFRPGNGRLNVSGGRYGKVGGTRYDDNYFKRLADAARRWLPELAGTEPPYTWAVDLAVTADMIPTLRSTGNLAPAYAIEGLGSLGVLPGMVLGQRVGALVARG
ncbi:MAG: FAD-dependent oxidoreductase [Ktedonobacteraceae bacterium]